MCKADLYHHGLLLVFNGTEKRAEAWRAGNLPIIDRSLWRQNHPSLPLSFFPFPCRDSSPYTMASGRRTHAPLCFNPRDKYPFFQFLKTKSLGDSNKKKRKCY